MTIKRKKKVCKGCGAEQYIFSQGLCLYCYKKTSAQAYDKPEKRLSIRSGSKPLPKRKSVSESTRMRLEQTRGYVFDAGTQVELFKIVWEEALEGNKVVCPFTGIDITRFRPPHDKWMHCCLHILPKGKYKKYRLAKKNIILAHPEFHRIVDQGTQAERLKHPGWDFDKWDVLKEKLKEEYGRQSS